MASFKQFNKGLTNSGPGRLGYQPTVATTDPANMAGTGGPPPTGGIMDPATYLFETPWVDAGGTEGGIHLIVGMTLQGYKVDQSDGNFREDVTDNTARVETNLAELGDIEKFVLIWEADPATTTVGGTLEKIKGIAAQRILTHRSLVVMEADDAGILRAFYLRDCARAAGDAQVSIAAAALHSAPWHCNAYADTTKPEKEFGYIMQQTGFSGVS